MNVLLFVQLVLVIMLLFSSGDVPGHEAERDAAFSRNFGETV